MTVREPEEVLEGVGRAAPIEGGPAGLGEAVDFGAACFSLSQVEKKSSPSAWGVEVPRGVSSRPSMWMPCGFLGA